MYKGNIYCFPNHPLLLILHFLQVLMFYKTALLFCLPAPLRPSLSSLWFCSLEVLQHSFGDFLRWCWAAGMAAQQVSPKSQLTELTAVCCLCTTLYFNKYLGAGVWYLWKLEVQTWAPSHCCGKSSPALLSSASVPRSSGRSWSREVLPRLPNLSRFNLESSSAANRRWQKQAQGESFALHPCFRLSQVISDQVCWLHLLNIFMKAPTIHPYLIIIIGIVRFAFLSLQSFEKRSIPDVNLRFSFLWWMFCYRSFLPTAAPPVTWGTQPHPSSTQPRLVCKF